MDEHLPGTKRAERLVTQPNGATMAEIIAATGGPQYNVLKKLEARGYRVRRVKEGKETRYFATPPAALSYEATVTSKGQVTLPKEVRERLRVRAGGKVRFTFEEGDRIAVARGGSRLSDLFGILGKPRRHATLEQMDEAVRQGAVQRYLRSTR
jgi:AbrB family looped-hinge helix DNA binding protein